MFRTAYFIIEKAEADNLKYNPDMIFIKDKMCIRDRFVQSWLPFDVSTSV